MNLTDIASHITPRDLERLGKYVEGHDRDDECWRWTGPAHERGYGRTNIGSAHLPAHRVLYAAAYGDFPADLELDHLCNNPWCVNPRHLEPVTREENIRRAIARRGWTGSLERRVGPRGARFRVRYRHEGKQHAVTFTSEVDALAYIESRLGGDR